MHESTNVCVQFLSAMHLENVWCLFDSRGRKNHVKSCCIAIQFMALCALRFVLQFLFRHVNLVFVSEG